MKKLSLIFFLALTCSLSFGQSKFIDSLSRELSVAIDEKSKILLISEIGFYYRIANPDSAFIFGKKALALAQKINFPQGESKAFGTIGATYHMLGDLQNGMLYCLKSISIAQKYGFQDELSRGYLIMGNTYSDLKEYDLAIKYVKLTIKIQETLDNKEIYGTAIANLGDIYLKKNQLDSALIYLQRANDLRISVTNSPILAFTHSRIAATHLKLKNYDTAYAYILKTFEFSKKGNSVRGICIGNQLLAKYFKSLNKIDSAIYYAKQGFDLAQKYNYKRDLLDNSNLLADLYEQKDIKQAYHYAKIYKSMNDSIYGVDRVNALQKKIIQEQELVRDNEAKNLAAQNRLKQNGLLLILGIMAIAGYFLYRNIRQKQQANQNLENTLSKLKSTQAQLIQSEKLASLGELTAGIAHEIQNPLNFVNNFSEVSGELVDEMEEELKAGNSDIAIEIAGDLKQNLSKINQHGKRASSIVSNMLEHSRTSTGERALTDINKLADEYLRLSYHGMRAKDSSFNADYELIVDETLPKIEVIPQDIGRVLLNLINNAFWAVASATSTSLSHQSNYSPKVTVSTRRLSEAEVEIRVTDNGAGIPADILPKIFQPFFTTKPTGQGTGLGLSLAYDIVVKGHGGTLEVASTEREGTTFIITLPFKANLA